jgi:hypothetical protein
VKTIAVKLPDDLLARLDAVGKRKSLNRSVLVRTALQRFLESAAHNTPPGSFLELAGSAVGCVKGPRDLSYAPRHMKGFGK